MKRYTRVTDKVVPLPRSDIDTDQIIPATHLKRVERTGYGQFLFQRWRTAASGEPDPEFPLNDPQFRSATILASGANFGCGSSREHAVWALLDYGFRTIVAPSFADIFRNNCYQNGVLPVTLAAPVVERILENAAADDAYRLTVDLTALRVSDTKGLSIPFAIDLFYRDSLLNGLDAIDLTLQHVEAIEAYERAHGLTRPTP